MYRVETLYLSPDYDNDLLHRNRDLIGFVVEKLTSKVKNVAVIERRSLAQWYHAKRAEYPEDKYELVLGSTSIIGTIRGAELKDVEDKEKADPLAYRVN